MSLPLIVSVRARLLGMGRVVKRLTLVSATIIAVGATIWFCWLQPPNPNIARQPGMFSWEWWRYPHEVNPYKRLPTVPYANLKSCFFTNNVGWAVGEGGVILNTTNGGKTWTLQTNVDWGEVEAEVFTPTNSVPESNSSVESNPNVPPEKRAQTANQTVNINRMPTNLPIQLRPGSGASEKKEQGDPKGAVTEQFQSANQSPSGTPTGVHDVYAPPRSHPNLKYGPANLNSVTFVDSQRGWAVGFARFGLILHTADGGRTWRFQNAASLLYARPSRLYSVAFADAQRCCVVGDYDTILYTDDAGQSWSSAKIEPHSCYFRSVTFVSPLLGWAVGPCPADNGGVSVTFDGGLSWKTRFVENAVSMVSVDFADEQHGWAVAMGAFRSTTNLGYCLTYTDDGGRSWLGQFALTSNFLCSLSAIDFVNGQQGWVVGTKGAIFHTDNGGKSWNLQHTNDSFSLAAVSFTDALHGWAVGAHGVVLHTQDGGKNWNPQTANIDVRGLTLEDDGSIATTEDGSVIPVEKGGKSVFENYEYRRWPAPLFYVYLLVAALLPVLFLAVFKPGKLVEPPMQSIAEFGVSDRPLTSKDYDALDFGQLVEGLSNFLRNRQTTGPLTLAITGAWGTGKSSVMGLLKEKLEAKGFRPVWFNAWHHQGETQLLAALLESIKSQTVPPWWSHIGIPFRCKLLCLRLQSDWARIFSYALLIALMAALALRFGDDLREMFESLVSGVLPDFISRQQAQAGGKLAALLAACVVGWRLLQGFRAFGVDPGKLLASVSQKARLSDLSDQTSIRHRFSKEFQEVTKALQPRTMTIFVDDLDRCNSDQVMVVLQSLNFLASSGECFLVAGMEENAVVNCVAASLDEQFDVRDGRKLDEAASLKQRWEYARRWMEKLIQIRIAVPKTTDEQYKNVLAGKKPEAGKSFKVWVQETWKWLSPYAPFMLVPLLMIGVFLLSYNFLKQYDEPNSAGVAVSTNNATATWRSNSVIQPDGLFRLSLDSADGIAGSNLITATNLGEWLASQKWIVRMNFEPTNQIVSAVGFEPTNEPIIEAASANPPPLLEPAPTEMLTNETPRLVALVMEPGHTGKTGIGFGTILLVAILIFIIKLYRNVSDPIPEDSDAFREALKCWSSRIQETHPTPRAAKRLINKLRFYAHMLRAMSKPGNLPQFEAAIVAFGVLEEDENVRQKIIDGTFDPNTLPEGLRTDGVAMNILTKDRKDVIAKLASWERTTASREEKPPANSQAQTKPA